MYTMKDVCKKLNISYDTLKYYCNEGLVPNVKRGANNYRLFDENDVYWINSLLCLRRCGMSIQDMKQYMHYCLQGKSAIEERIEMLEKTKEDLYHQLDEINDSIDYVTKKIQLYQDMADGKKEYVSHLIDVDEMNKA